ncbi:MAG: AIR synthase [Desulfovibrio sp.]|nr:AIR synthase [Desulfovibrio sp.]
MPTVQQLASRLASSAVFQGKRSIDAVRGVFGHAFDAFGIANGDDTAAVPDGQGGWLLLAAEGILPEMAQNQPELAGRCAVLANVNDVYAMGGRPLAMVDVVGSPSEENLAAVCRGMRDNALRFNVPIVGGHVQATAGAPSVALAIMGRAKSLLTSFDAEPGDSLVLVTNLDGVWLRDDANYWNCTLPRHDANLVPNLELIPQAAERGLAKACKDVSMAGIAGTLVMLCEASGVGCELDCDSIPLPAGCDREADLEPWLRAFFSYGFLLAAREENLPELVRPFLARGLYAARIGVFTSGSKVMLWQGGSTALLHDWAETPFTGYQGREGGRP